VVELKLHLAFLVIVLLFVATAITNSKIGLAEDYQFPAEAELTEIVNINVNCTTANVSVTCGVISNNTMLVHFPAEINMNITELLNATEVVVGFSTEDSFLWIVFNNTEVGGAEKYANVTVETYFEPVFGREYMYNSTSVEDTYVNVTFTGSAVANLTEYTEGLMTECLAFDLGGFSLTFIPMTYETGACTLIGAQKESGGFDWMYAMGVMYHTTIPDGPGEHTIDVLDLLDVESLAPSPYSQGQSGITIVYMSMVMLTINSSTPVTFVSCKPGQASPPARGWYIYPQIQPTQLQAMFMFGDSPLPVNVLSLTFSGEIIPEFTTPMLIAVLTFAAAVAVALKKRFIRK
jgi:hypothetical protein